MQTNPTSRPFRFARAFGLTTLALVSCARTSPTPVDSQQVRQEIDRINDRTSQWWDAGLSDSIAGTYAEDATMIEQNEAPVRGRAAIRARMRAANADSVVEHLRSSTDELRVADTIAVEKGHFVVDVRRKPPADTTKSLFQDRGNYLTIWVLRSGTWRILYDMDASAMPAKVSR